MTALLRAYGVSKQFGGMKAVKNVDLEIIPGEIHCLIGPNGAGKSTMFKLIIGYHQPDGGKIDFDGTDITRAKSFARVQRGMSIKLQKPSVFKELSTRLNLHVALQQKAGRNDIAAEEEKLLSLLGLETHAQKDAGLLSHGQQQWLEIGMALALSPKLLLLDEPTAGMSEEETFRTGELIKRLNDDGMTILAVEHDMSFVRQIAHNVTVMHLGEVFARGKIEDIIADERVAEIYLGKGHGH
ncbi:ABC transporter ATP-binding protein [Mesorhizobium sanjuanii]|uniref:ABC transporter ATP-binding protein n=1 Tax=Mesorhizobium sanjuanii TaxID=2037900 RepID=A0A2A6FLS7_9HYPH|nr:ABC transporter ATP-binding protein [Mesorhizobium sanjuanii]PDQ22692.1 ABC transporter ATP-binding protein [Mesorhizobium sanjuanii]